jgi:large subunit ribosomal protein L3
MSHRRIGSVGSNTDPGRILKGLHMPGHMGDARVTVHNLEIVEVDKESNLLLLKGAVPGGRGSYLIITKSFKKKKKEPKVVLVKKEKDALKESKRSMKKIIKEKKK